MCIGAASSDYRRVPVVQNEPHLTKHVQAALSLRRRHRRRHGAQRGGANTAPLKA